MCKYNLNESSSELVAVKFANSDPTGNIEDMIPLFITDICSSESMCFYTQKPYDTNILGEKTYVNQRNCNTNHIWTKEPLDYVTVTYRNINESYTGTLKIITVEDHIVTGAGHTDDKTVLAKNNGCIHPFIQSGNVGGDDDRAVYATMMGKTSTTNNYPNVWLDAVRMYESSKEQRDSIDTVYKNSEYITIWTSNCQYVRQFYSNLKTAMPLLMGYRWHTQIFSQLTNSSGRSVTDFSDE